MNLEQKNNPSQWWPNISWKAPHPVLDQHLHSAGKMQVFFQTIKSKSFSNSKVNIFLAMVIKKALP